MKIQNSSTISKADVAYGSGAVQVHISQQPLWTVVSDSWGPSRGASSASAALKKYKNNRNNGEQQDSPQHPFPSNDFEKLDISTARRQFGKWPDPTGKYWWELTLKNGQKVTDFYWMADKSLGYPIKDGKNNNCWWFIIGHMNGTQIRGFCQKPNYEADFPERGSGKYYYDFEFNDTYCIPIREWMEARDLKYLLRIKHENPALYQQEITKHFAHPAVKQLVAVTSDLYAKPWPAVDAQSKDKSANIPKDFYCPITHEIMLDPVIAMDGHTYERQAIEKHFQKPTFLSSNQVIETSSKEITPSLNQPAQPSSPMTNALLENTMLLPNAVMRSMIRSFLDENPSCWNEVYLPPNQCSELQELITTESLINLSRFSELLQSEPRLLYRPLENQLTLLELICQQKDDKLKEYLPVLISLLKANDWKQLLTQQSIHVWLDLLATTCERSDMLPQLRNYLERFESMLDITLIPLNWTRFSLEKKQLSLFKLFVPFIPNINEVIDDDGNTLLHLAAFQGLFEAIEILTQLGGNLKQRNNVRLKPEAIARQAQQQITADNIVALKLTPVLEKIGVFSVMKRVEVLEQRNQILEEQNAQLLSQNQALKSRVESLEQTISERIVIPEIAGAGFFRPDIQLPNKDDKGKEKDDDYISDRQFVRK